MISSERPGFDLSESTLFSMKNIFFIHRKTIFSFFCIWRKYKRSYKEFSGFFLITSKTSWFFKFRWLHRKNHIKIHQTISSFKSTKDFQPVRYRFFFSEKIVNSGVILFTLQSNTRICNQMHFTSFYYDADVCCIIYTVTSKRSKRSSY